MAVFAEQPLPDRHPTTGELAIEVAVSSQLIDRNVKAAKYARANIPTYWLVDVPARAVEVRTEPGSDGYADCQIYREGSLVPSPLQDVSDLDIAALLADVAG